MRYTSPRRHKPTATRYDGAPTKVPSTKRNYSGPDGVYCPSCRRIIGPRQIGRAHSVDGYALKPWNRCPSVPQPWLIADDDA